MVKSYIAMASFAADSASGPFRWSRFTAGHGLPCPTPEPPHLAREADRGEGEELAENIWYGSRQADWFANLKHRKDWELLQWITNELGNTGTRRERGWSWVGEQPDEFSSCLCPFTPPFPLPSRFLLSENHISLAWMGLGKPGRENCWRRGLNCINSQWREVWVDRPEAKGNARKLSLHWLAILAMLLQNTTVWREITVKCDPRGLAVTLCRKHSRIFVAAAKY